MDNTMTSTVNIYKPGNKCRLNVTDDSGIDGVIMAALIGMENKVQYQVVWWDKATRTETWLEKAEIYPYQEDEKVAIGFHSQDEVKDD